MCCYNNTLKDIYTMKSNNNNKKRKRKENEESFTLAV